jgi:hypothetical protein
LVELGFIPTGVTIIFTMMPLRAGGGAFIGSELSDLNEVRKRFTQVKPDMEIVAIHPFDENVFSEVLTIWG